MCVITRVDSPVSVPVPISLASFRLSFSQHYLNRRRSLFLNMFICIYISVCLCVSKLSVFDYPISPTDVSRPGRVTTCSASTQKKWARMYRMAATGSRYPKRLTDQYARFNPARVFPAHPIGREAQFINGPNRMALNKIGTSIRIGRGD